MASWRACGEGSVPFEGAEAAGTGDVYREVKVGTVFRRVRGLDRSTLAPGQWVDTLERVDRSSAERDASPAPPATSRAAPPRRLRPIALPSGGRGRACATAREVVVLGDGAVWIWGLADEHFPGAVQIVDFWHAQQHVWNVAHAAVGSRHGSRSGLGRGGVWLAGRMATWSA